MAKRANADKIMLGSGKAYIAAYSEATGIPDVATICTDDNLLGKIKGGAELTYTTETHEESDDLGTVTKVVVTREEAILKLGLIAFNGNTIKKLVDRCEVAEAGGKRTVKIGGADRAQGNDWVVCFHHEDEVDGDIWVIVRGANQAGLTLTYATDSASVVEPEFKALPAGEDGVLITYIEEIGTTGTTGT